ncbi:XK-related protein 6 [Nymphon striatum]|nr:XK-related protein 6 [Nymphon striatum]
MTEHKSSEISDERTPNVAVGSKLESVKDEANPHEDDFAEPECGVDTPDRQRDETDSLMWYFDDKKSRIVRYPPLTSTDKMIRYGLHGLGLGPIIRYYEAIVFGAYSRGQEMRKRKKEIQKLLNVNIKEFKEEKYDYEKLMYCADRDASMLSLIKSFGQSAPQLILQIYILVIRKHYLFSSKASASTDAWQVFSITMSLLSFAWGIASYQRNLRFCVENANILTRKGQAAMFFWRLGMILSRVFSLALFASHFKYWLAPILLGHWGAMTMWIIHQNTIFCSTDLGKPVYWKEYLYNMIMGVVYIFCYFNVKNEPTFHKYKIYYIIVFLENCICISLWYHYSDSSVWYYRPAIALVFVSFILGLVMMFIYYGFLHPNGPRIDIQRFIKSRSLSTTGESNSNKNSTERQSLFGVCCSNGQNISQNISQDSEENTAPLEPKGNKPAVYTIEEDKDVRLSETGL